MDIITEPLENNLDSFLLRNKNNMSVTILNYGASIAKIEIPDNNGKIENVILEHRNLSNFIGGPYYFGATIGRYANRIAGDKFKIDGKKYKLSLNKPGITLHGGNAGFDKKFWQSRVIACKEGSALELSLISSDGEKKYFPGIWK